MIRYLLHSVWVLFLPFWGHAQYGVQSHYEELPSDTIEYDRLDVHTIFNPQIRQFQKSVWDYNYKKKNFFSIAPAIDLNGSYSRQFLYRTGLGFDLKAQAGKWYFKVGALGGIGTVDSVFHTTSYYLEKKGANYYFADIRGRISYTPNEIFNFQIGLDNQFIGEGNRSLFLSDYGAPHPFAQIQAKFWRAQYTIMYQFMREHTNSMWKSKYATSHHLSINAAKWLSFGIFESVLFQAKDTLLNRGFDAEYLNPVVFFRPQEYALGSADNIITGLSMELKLKHHMFYTQFVLDEFNLAEIRKDPSWWANKYGLQVGVKGRFQSRIGTFFYRGEYNSVRPYTYSHLDVLQAYGNQGQTLAHPLGANFHELVFELKWQYGKYLAKIFTNYYLKGFDKDGFSYGGNIYMPYTKRPEDYGHYIARGKGRNISHSILEFDYSIMKSINLHAFIEHHVYVDGNTMNVNYIPVIGIRSQLWNDYRNY